MPQDEIFSRELLGPSGQVLPPPVLWYPLNGRE
jgi:hypothetical protein